MKFSATATAFLILLSLSMTTQAAEKLPISSICIDADSGRTLAAEHENIQRPPASVIKLAMMMLVYLFLSLLTSAFMNWYNKRIALVER